MAKSEQAEQTLGNRHGHRSNFAIVRCSHKTVDMVRAAASVTKELNGRPIVLYSLGVSGTIKISQGEDEKRESSREQNIL